MKAYWTAAVQHTWPLEKRLKAMKVAIRGRKPVSEEERARRAALLEGPTQRVYRIVKDGLGKCSACGVAKRKGYRSSERDFEHQLCRKCYMDWRKHLFKMRKAWDDELPPEGLALWNQMPADVVKLDHPTKRQAAIAKRRQRKGKVWQELFGLRSFKQLLNLEFFTHRMEPEKAASFVTKHAELFRRAQMAQPMPEKREDVARCLAAKRRRWRKRSEDHPRTALKGLMPRAFFTHRLDEAASFLERFSKILTPVEEDPGQSPSDKG